MQIIQELIIVQRTPLAHILYQITFGGARNASNKQPLCRLPNYDYDSVLALAVICQTPPSAISFVLLKCREAFTWFTLAQM